jgi:predicted ATP-dependent serine protease
MTDMTKISEARCRTGVDGLDTVLRGGFPAHRIYLIQGRRVLARPPWRCSFSSKA